MRILLTWWGSCQGFIICILLSVYLLTYSKNNDMQLLFHIFQYAKPSLSSKSYAFITHNDSFRLASCLFLKHFAIYGFEYRNNYMIAFSMLIRGIA